MTLNDHEPLLVSVVNKDASISQTV